MMKLLLVMICMFETTSSHDLHVSESNTIPCYSKENQMAKNSTPALDRTAIMIREATTFLLDVSEAKLARACFSSNQGISNGLSAEPVQEVQPLLVELAGLFALLLVTLCCGAATRWKHSLCFEMMLCLVQLSACSSL